MNKIFKLTALVCLLAAGLVSCTPEELSTDQLSDDSVMFSGFAPNPIVRGAELRILGSNLDKIVEVHVPGSEPITDIDVIATGKSSEIRVTVPVDGAEDLSVTGPVEIVDQAGNVYASKTQISFIEGISIDSFSPVSAMPGDVITVTGDYLYSAQQIILKKDVYVTGDQIVSKTRRELKFIVPANAITGIVTIGDVDESNNPNGLIPNNIASKAILTVGKPTVASSDRGVLKSSDQVVVKGEYLNMIETVRFGDVEADILAVAEDNKSLTVALPKEASDGQIVLTTFAGDEFDAGSYTTLVPSELKITAESRYKAGLNVIVTGKDLDLVTGVKIADVDATFSTTAEKTTVVLPAESADGDVVLSLANGKTVTAGAVEVVKPVIESLSVASVVAGKTFDILGKDLDLVTTVSVGEIAADSLEVAEDKIVVYTSRLSKTGDVVAAAANGEEAVSSIEVTYDESIAITDMPSTVEAKSEFVFKGTGLGQIEAIYIDGVKVIAYTTRTDTEFGFMLPDDVTPGVYTMDIVLISGEALTWAIPFEVTGSYKLTTVWEAPGGQIDLTWGDPRPSVPVAAFENLPKGSSMIFCFTQKNETWGQIQINNGQWQGLVFPEVGSNTFIPTDYYGWEFAYREFEVQLTDDIIATIKANAGDLNGVQTGVILQGDGMYFNKIVIKSPSEVAETVIWKGSEYSSDDMSKNLELGSEDDWNNAGLKEGQKIRIYFTTTEPEQWKIQVFGGHWEKWYLDDNDGNQSPEALFGPAFKASNWNASSEYIEFAANGDLYKALTTKQWWGSALILQGQFVTFTKISFL